MHDLKRVILENQVKAPCSWLCNESVDHPHGGRTKSGLKVSLWGKDTKGKKTRKDNLIMRSK